MSKVEHHRPEGPLVGVSALALPEWLVEIEAVAPGPCCVPHAIVE
jgi:enamine deaminase RidA (YjgF/YER057c/UK114 family)